MQEPRLFYMAPERELEQQNWVYRLGFQIDYYALQEQNKGVSERVQHDFDVYQVTSSESILSDAESRQTATVAGVRATRVDAAGGSRRKTAASTAAAPSTPRISTTGRESATGRESMYARVMNRTSLIPKSSSRPSGPNPNAASRAKRGRGSIAPLSGEFENPGARIEGMTAGDFKAISQDEALATFWESYDTTMDDVLVIRQNHNISYYFEFGDWALVSRNGAGQIDGYLLGFASSRKATHAVVHQVAVLPNVRRHGVGTKLYNAFQQKAVSRGCTMTRALVPKDNPSAIAFHRALGFEELDEDSERINDLGGDFIVFIKSNSSSGALVTRLSNITAANKAELASVQAFAAKMG